jgi:hypothetical protein
MARLSALREQMVAMVEALPSQHCPAPLPGSWCPRGREEVMQEPGKDRIKLTDSEGEGAQEDTQRRRRPDDAEQPAHGATPEQVPVVDRIRAGDHASHQRRHLNPWIGALVSRHSWHVASPANPARAARATSGANPAHDTRFGRNPSTFPASRESRRYFTEIIE